MKRIVVKTLKPKQVVDISAEVEERVVGGSGWCSLFVLHTTCALTTADLDPGTDLDMLDAFEELMPKLDYRHPHDPGHVPDHILSSLIGPSLIVPVEEGSLCLGTWQRVVLIEFSGPREREVVLEI